MAEAKSLQPIDNTPWEKTLSKIEQFDRAEKTQKQKRNEVQKRKEAVDQLTNRLLDFSGKFFSISREAIAKLEPEECQTLCENLLSLARQKRRLFWRIFGTVAVPIPWMVAAALPFVMSSLCLEGIILSVTIGAFAAVSFIPYIWNSATLDFLKAYRKCLRFSDKPGALMVEHAREIAQKEIPKQS